MPDISFYLLRSDSEKERLLFVCKLVEKAYRTDPNVYILTESEKQSRLLDDHLWTFRAGSFIPHQMYTGSVPDFYEQVLIGCMPAPDNWRKTIVNLSNVCPENPGLSSRILEILDNRETCKKAGRARYRQYQSLSWPIQTHKI